MWTFVIVGPEIETVSQSSHITCHHKFLPSHIITFHHHTSSISPSHIISFTITHLRHPHTTRSPGSHPAFHHLQYGKVGRPWYIFSHEWRTDDRRVQSPQTSDAHLTLLCIPDTWYASPCVPQALYVSDHLQAGTVFVNTYNKTDVAAPFGGFKQSGFGKDLGKMGKHYATRIHMLTHRTARWERQQTAGLIVSLWMNAT